jgi:hypothetical protein
MLMEFIRDEESTPLERAKMSGILEDALGEFITLEAKQIIGAVHSMITMEI